MLSKVIFRNKLIRYAKGKGLKLSELKGDEVLEVLVQEANKEIANDKRSVFSILKHFADWVNNRADIKIIDNDIKLYIRTTKSEKMDAYKKR